MSFTGYVQNGAIVFPVPLPLPDGTEVQVLLSKRDEPGATDAAPTHAEIFRDFIGSVADLPPDMADQHDHYIHGTPKR